MVDTGEQVRNAADDDVAVEAGTQRVTRAPRWRRLATDAAVLYGLAAVAVTQPVLELFGQNPTFFVAGNYGRRKTVAFALVVTLVPGAVVFLTTVAARALGPSAAAVARTLGVAGLAGLFGLVLCRTVGLDGTVTALAVATCIGAGVAFAEARLSTVRRFLAYLAAGNVAFLALFVFASPSAELLRGTVYVHEGRATAPRLEGPVTVVVLDEFPLAALLRPDGSMNEVRYPNLAALAAESTWFRNASAEVSTTYLSVPEILTGVQSRPDDLPTYGDHPRNLFTLFGEAYPVNRYEVVTDLCPPDTCGQRPTGPLRQALSDAVVVYGHRVLPERLRADLPAVDQGWGNFGDKVGGITSEPAASSSEPSGEPDPMARLEEVPAEDTGRIGQSAALMRQIRLIDGEPSVNLVHVLLPHHPYQLTPWGVTNENTWVPAEMPAPDDPRHERAFAELYAMQAMQVAAVDQMVGEIRDHLEGVGAWDTGTFVLVSDHGIDITAPRFTRAISGDNGDGILRIPLIVKAQGQTAGEVRDEPASTLDVLPSLVDLLGVDVDWEMDGRSLFDGTAAGYRRALSGETFEDGLDYVARQQEHVGEGDGWTSVLAIGEQGDLVGTQVDDHVLGEPSRLSWSYEGADRLSDPAGAGGAVPVQLRGVVRGTDARPADLVVALDGVISGTIGGFVETDGGWSFTGLLGPDVEGGADEVVAYEVVRAGGTVTLHPLDT